jgi:hypothetical protein
MEWVRDGKVEEGKVARKSDWGNQAQGWGETRRKEDFKGRNRDSWSDGNQSPVGLRSLR